MKRTRSAGGVVLNKNGEVLVVNQHGNSWSLPKGHAMLGEDDLETAKREIYEESGVRDLEMVKELGSYERFRIGKHGPEDASEQKTITLFLFKTDQMRLGGPDPDHPEARWVPKENVADLLTHEKDKEFFKKIMNEL